jgi:sigma-B regulation protein RsbU (phosphoserine phosphatase)
MPLAVQSDGDFPAVAVPPLEPGELLLLLTDGMVEALGPGDTLFGMDRILDVVRSHHDQTSRAIVDALYGAVRDFCGIRAQHDDMTTIVIKAVVQAT